MYKLAKDFNSFLVIILTNFNKAISYFVPHIFKEGETLAEVKKLCFYWINNNQRLVTCSNSDVPAYLSNNYWLIEIDRMVIWNDREEEDRACLDAEYWIGM